MGQGSFVTVMGVAVLAFMVKGFEEPAVVDEFPEPASPDADQVTVRVQAASLSRLDSYVARGLMRGFMDHVFPVVLGRDFAGVVEQVGEAVDGFTVGDAVMGAYHCAELHLGTIAERAVIHAGPRTLAHRPAGLAVLIAAAVPLAGQAALTSVDAVAPRPGEKVLVVGACGGVGGFVVQLAAASGAHVIAAGCSDDSEYLRGFGAADVIDHGAGLLEQLTTRYPDGVDVLIDAVHSADAPDAATFTALTERVKSGGRVSSTALAADVAALSARGIAASNVMADLHHGATINRLIELLGTGELQPPRLHVFPLSEAAMALKHFDSGHTAGKYLIQVP